MLKRPRFSRKSRQEDTTTAALGDAATDELTPEQRRQRDEIVGQLLMQAGRLLATKTLEIDEVEDEEKKPVETIKKPELSQEEWAQAQYEKVKGGWGKYGIEVPDQAELQERLLKAHSVMKELETADYQLEGKMGVLLVPPSDVLGWPVSRDLRREQGVKPGTSSMSRRISNTDDRISSGFNAPELSDEWRILVTATSPSGVSYGSPDDIVDENKVKRDTMFNQVLYDEDGNTIPLQPKYMVGGHNTLGMGASEYAALSLQEEGPIDANDWTWLLKDFEAGSETAEYATFSDTVNKTYVMAPKGQYCSFETIRSDYAWNGARYRPTVEIE